LLAPHPTLKLEDYPCQLPTFGSVYS